jgi:hypothetical protein
MGKPADCNPFLARDASQPGKIDMLREPRQFQGAAFSL